MLVLDRHEEIARLMAMVLEDEGYEVVRGDHARPLEAIRAHRPSVLVLSLPLSEEEAYATLDALRADEVARAVPVVVTAGLSNLAASALASYNVRAGLSRPFDLDRFSEAVAGAANQPTLDAVARGAGIEGGATWAADLLAKHSRAALFRWLQRVREVTYWRDHPEAPVGDVLDSVPVLIEALVLALRAGDTEPEAFLRGSPGVLARARDHARARAQQGVPIATVLREYTLLRNEVWEVYRRHTPEQVTARELLGMGERINLTLDLVVEETVGTYIAARGGPSVSR